MSSIASTTKSIDTRQSVTSISTNARIDYILRFSQHAVLVIDEDPELCTQIGNQFLGALTKEHNAAYVSLSSNLNDIQIRCRVIEQLFGNSLFDPEQPLAVNVLKLSENTSEIITIVIGHAEHLSLQLFHELCQLAETAKKLKKTVNVVFLGSNDAGQLIADNSSLFDKNISIIQATNGQLVGLSSPLFKKKTTPIIKIIIKVVVLLVIIIAILILMFTSNLWLDDELTKGNKLIPASNVIDDKFVVVNIKDITQKTLIPKNIATSSEVFHLLTKEVDEINVKVAKPILDPNKKGVQLNQDNTVNHSNITSNIDVPKVNVNIVKSIIIPTEELNENYYQSLKSGVVIQFASFENVAGYDSFINTYKTYQFKGYPRKLGEVKSHIVTSEVYKTNLDAKNAILDLPQELKARGPWIKSIQGINNEIKVYQQAK